MTISPMKKDSKRSPNSPPNNKLKPRKSDMKKKLSTKGKFDEESVNIDNKRMKCYKPEEPRTPAMERAEMIQNNLPLNSTSLIRDMQISHVSGGFWLGLKRQFCVKHLPECDKTITLVVDGEKNGTPTKYLAYKHGLSGGWRGFSIDHGLLEGDFLVFELIEPWEFKVHIVRAIEPTANAVHDAPIINQPKLIMLSARMHRQKSLVHFDEVKCFEDFKIQIKGSTLDLKIPKLVKEKYYRLCKSRNKFLHENLAEGFDRNEAAKVISKTISIVEAIEEAKHSTDLGIHRETLKSFEGLGMEVGFLSVLIDKTPDRIYLLESKRNLLKVKLEEKIRLETRSSEVRMSIQKRTDEIRLKSEKFQAVFLETARAPWKKI